MATAYVKISPDTDGFAEELEAKVQEAADGAEGNVKIGADDAELDEVLDDAKAKLTELDGSEGRVTLSADDEDLSEKVDDAKGKLEELSGTRAEPVVLLDKGDFDADTDAATEKLDQLGESSAAPTVELDDDAFGANVDSVTEKLVALNAQQARPSADLNDDSAKAKIDDLKLQLSILKAQKNGISITADASDAEVKIATLQAQIAALKEEAASGVVLDGDKGKGEGGGGGDSGGGEGGMFGWLPGGAMTAAAIAGSSLLPGAGGAATGLGLLGGTGMLALAGPIGAVSAGIQSQDSPGVSAQEEASQQFANQVQTTQAQEQLTAAQTQQSHDQITSAQAVSQAQSSLAETQRNAAASQVQALQSVTSAEQGVQEATYNLSEANYNLAQAYVQAREQITQLNDQLNDSKLSVAAASLAVQQAQYQETLTNQSAYSTDLDREQASLAVAQAKQQLTDATNNESDAQTAANLANKQGVDGSQTVIQAKQSQLSATQQLTDSQEAATQAQTALKDTELNNAAEVKASELQLAQARQQQAWTAQADALAVSEAQANLTDTLKEQKLQWSEMLAEANSSQLTFLTDMERLSPAGRGFVNAVMQLYGPFKQLEAVAQSTVLPGMGIWLNGIKSLLPEISNGVREMGTAMGNSFAQFGKYMQTPAFAKVLDGLISNGMKFANIVLPAVAGFIQDLAKVGSQKGAVDGLANVLGGLFDGLGNMVTAMGPFVTGLSSMWSGLGKALSDLGGPIGQVIGSLGSALAPVVQGLLPGFKALVDALGNGLSKALIGIAPLLGAGAKTVSILVEAFAPLLPVIGTLIGKIGTELAPVIVALMPSVQKLADGLGQQLAAQGQTLIGMVIQLLPPLVQLAVSLTPLIGLAVEATLRMTEWATEILDHVAPAITFLVSKIVWFQNEWDYVVTHVEDVALYLWHDVFDPMWQGIVSGVEWAVSGASKAWAGLESAFKTPVNFLIKTVYDDGIMKLWNDVVGAVGLSSLKLPVMPQLAGGGVLPGYSPGHDTVPAMLSPGEAVLTPGATRAIGGAPVVNALNAAHAPGGGSRGAGHFAFGGTAGGEDDESSGGGSGGGEIGKEARKQAVKHSVERPAEHALTAGMMANGGIVQRFSLGGIVSGLVGDVKGVLSGGESVAKAVAALATGNTVAFTNALKPMIGTSASGVLGRVMIGIPTTLVADAAKAAIGMLGGGSGSTGGSSGAMGTLPQNYHTIASYLAAHGFTKNAAAGVTGNIDAESGGDPEAIEIGGGGGGGLIQWTPWQSYGPLITGNASQDLMTQLAAILTFGGGPAIVNKATSPSNAAELYQDYYEKPASETASLGTRMAAANSTAKAMGWAYDSGGWLQPGMQVPVNQLGKPEAVLTPEESAAFVAIVKQMTSSGGAGAEGRPQVNQYFTGPQIPSQEQLAEMYRQLSLAVGG